ncbi:MAG: EamA family transporter [Bacteroidales bacterium]|nr:EamA family transporter [Bacteroidales bacterium]
MRLFLLAILQSTLLVAGQVLLKFALGRMLPFAMTAAFWRSVFANWQFAACGLCYGAGTILWFHIIKNYPFSTAYPLVSLSYVLGMVAAIVFFHEPVSIAKWIGVLLILAGCYLISR